MLNLPEVLLFFPAFFIGIYVCWTDMKFMRIPNNACLALLGSFLILGFLIFDLQEYGIRLAQGAVILALGFLVTSLGLVGGGDSKFAAVIAPFIALSHAFQFIFIVAIISFISLALHKLIAVTPVLRQHTEKWASWDPDGMFPFGITLAGSLIVYLFLVNFYS
ncbi:hypothetical protein F9L33_12795 [Amylibacter sp. SFDW26]|uniref:A24 family peptidase n=1 Tax=Amylibacter sp. SFDW26 TaxID=2652722 RepID=UPI001261D5BD|nr:prepilin peptidase [Amylibacter sp. SFDW26]KAB7613466.1 hypothetical protein F9L33_12795 [Amylibacter sp. SFDW26]